MKELIRKFVSEYPKHEDLEVNILAFLEWVDTQHRTDGTPCWCSPRKEVFSPKSGAVGGFECNHNPKESNMKEEIIHNPCDKRIEDCTCEDAQVKIVKEESKTNWEEFVEATRKWHEILLINKEKPCVMCGCVPDTLLQMIETADSLLSSSRTELLGEIEEELDRMKLDIDCKCEPHRNALGNWHRPFCPATTGSTENIRNQALSDILAYIKSLNK